MTTQTVPSIGAANTKKILKFQVFLVQKYKAWAHVDQNSQTWWKYYTFSVYWLCISPLSIPIFGIPLDSVSKFSSVEQLVFR